MDGLTYAEVGRTREAELPSGYRHLHRERVIGRGRRDFERAAGAVMSWGVQRGAGLAVHAGAARAAPGVRVTVRLGVGRMAVSAPCVVVYTVEDDRRRGFAYGTAAGHPERGEELFVVELRDDDTVALMIRAFSRPAAWWSRLGSPVARLVQSRVTERYLRSLDH